MATQPLALARVVIFTADSCITADLATGGERVKDVLNSQSALLELSRITYSNPDRPGVPLVDYPKGTLRKSDIGCVVVLSEPPQMTMRKLGVYVQKRPVRLSILIPGMVVVGLLHVQGRFDPAHLLSDKIELFVPMTEAGVVRARTTTPTAVPPERLTVFVNKAHINGVLLSESTDAASAQPEPAAPRPAQQGAGALPPGAQSPSHTGRLRRLTAPDSTW